VGHGVPADREEALRLFRQAVEWGEEKAVKEVERLEGVAKYGRIPEGFIDRTQDGTGFGLIGGVRPREKVEETGKTSKIRFVDATETGKHFGLVGVGGVAPPAEDEEGVGTQGES